MLHIRNNLIQTPYFADEAQTGTERLNDLPKVS